MRQEIKPSVQIMGFVACPGPSHYIAGLMQERRNSIANALELRFSCTNPSIRNNNDIRWALSRQSPATRPFTQKINQTGNKDIIKASHY